MQISSAPLRTPCHLGARSRCRILKLFQSIGSVFAKSRRVFAILAPGFLKIIPAVICTPAMTADEEVVWRFNREIVHKNRYANFGIDVTLSWQPNARSLHSDVIPDSRTRQHRFPQ